MFALQPEPEAGRRLQAWMLSSLLSALVSGLVIATLANWGASWTPPMARPMPAPVSFSLHQSLPPATLTANSSPRNEPLDSPTPAQLPKKPSARPAQKADVAQQALPSTTSQPPPLVVGLTLSSTSVAGLGPKVSVGDTLLGTPSTLAQAPREPTLAPLASPTHQLPGPTTPPHHTSKKLTAARLIRPASPSYPLSAKRAGIEGVVVLAISIDERGCVVNARVLSGLGHGLDQAAVSAARKTLWQPATLGESPVATTRRLKVRFSLQG